ncbi:MAG: hypothetical protein NT085_05190 [candidate division SR1 bacterium]|nr:hypothetical protein [candidate division SR1 bacterium]
MPEILYIGFYSVQYMKKVAALTIILVSVITFVNNFSFAATPALTPDQLADRETAYCAQSSICGTAPEQFTFLMDFVREMTNAIKTVGPQGEYLGKYVNPNRFKGTEFSAPKKTILGRFASNVANKAKFALATLTILSNPVNFGGLKDMVGGVTLLAKNKIFLRDNKIIEDTESLVNDKKYELGLGGGWYAQIIPENRAIMQAIIDTYKAKGLLVDSSIIKDGTTYNNVTALLTQALSSAKSFLYFGTTSQFDEMSRGFSDGISIGFVPTAMASVKREYDCARGPNYVCSSEGKKLKEWRKKITQISIGSKDITKVYTDAVHRLGQLFSKQPDQAFKDREADLLNSAYGARPTGLFAGSIKNSLKKIKDQAVDLANDVSTFRTFPPNIKGVTQALPTALTVPTQATDPIVTQIDTYVYDVLNNQQNAINLVSMSEVNGVTPAFKILGNQIASIKNDILGGKDKKNSLISSLGAACELQCGRSGLCR